MKKVRICGIDYELVRGEVPTPDGKPLQDGGTMLGRVTFNDTVIIVTNKRHVGKERLYFTFIHECLHALLGESTADKFIKKKDWENFVALMEAPLGAFIRDNISLIRKFGRF